MSPDPSRFITAYVGALTILATLAFCTDGQAATVRELPGLSGRSVEVVAAAPSPGGETTIVANMKDKGSSTGTISAIRLRADGAPQIGFGKWGVGRFPSSGRALSATVDPQSGRLYVAAIASGKPSVLALDARGEVDRDFGSEGVLRLPGSFDSGSFRVTSAAGYLFVFSGAGDCSGCTIRELHLPSGTLATTSTLSRDQLAGKPGCTRARVGDVAVLAGRLVLGVEACGRLLVDIPEPHDADGGALRGSRIPLGGESVQSVLRTDADQGYACLASKERNSVRLGSARYTNLTGLPSAGGQVSGNMIIGDVTAFGSYSCAVLVAGSRRSRVLLADRQGSPRLVRVSGLGRVDALASCGKGLLALGSRRVGKIERAALSVVSKGS